jgi:hypothetical protein
MVYLYDACDQISDFCHQQLLRKVWRKISWTDGSKTVYPRPPSGSGGITRIAVCRLSWFLYILNIYAHFCHIFLSNYWWQKSDIWSQASYRYPISWEAFLNPSDSYFLFADFVDFYTHLTYICICTFFGYTYMTLVTKYQISAINSYWEKCDEKYLGRMDRGETVYPPPPSGSEGIKIKFLNY